MDPDAPTFPGFDPAPAGPVPHGPIRRAAAATLQALQDDGALSDRHAITCAIILRLAEAVDHGLAAPKVSVATGTLSRHLLDAIASLPEQATAGGDDWDRFTEQLAKAAAGQTTGQTAA